jgi:hypothetical protein
MSNSILTGLVPRHFRTSNLRRRYNIECLVVSPASAFQLSGCRFGHVPQMWANLEAEVVLHPIQWPMKMFSIVLARNSSPYHGLARGCLHVLNYTLAIKEGSSDLLLDESFLGRWSVGQCHEHYSLCGPGSQRSA